MEIRKGKENKMSKRYNINGEKIIAYITEEFDSNHILHMNSSKRGELNVWWGYDLPTEKEIANLYDKHRGEIQGAE